MSVCECVHKEKAKRMCVGVVQRDQSGEYGALRDQRRIKERAAKSDERELDSARRLIILRRVDVCREWRAYFGLKILYIYI